MKSGEPMAAPVSFSRWLHGPSALPIDGRYVQARLGVAVPLNGKSELLQYVSYQPANIGFLSLVIVKITERDHYAFTSYGPLYVLPVIEAVAVDARSPALVQGFGNIANAIGHRVACVVQRNDPARVQFLDRLVQAVAISLVWPS